MTIRTRKAANINKLGNRFVAIRCVFQALNTPKLVSPDSAEGAYDASPNPQVGWGGGHPLPIPLPLDDFGVSISAPSAKFGASVVSPPTQIPVYAYVNYSMASDTQSSHSFSSICTLAVHPDRASGPSPG